MSLSSHYSRFRVSERLLLTGHSHQAWPDIGFEAQQQAWLDAAALVDDKWERAAEVAAHVQQGFARLLNDPDATVTLGQNTHELVVRWLSALPLETRPRLVTTDGEFHTIRRQMDRLAETRLDVVKIAARPVRTLAERIAASVDDRTAGVMVSSVLFETAEIVPGLEQIAAACEREGAELLVDAYHHVNVVPFDVRALGLDRAFIVGGGYKYCQMGEGNCFLRVPPACEMRPVLTGWFSEFAELAERKTPGDLSAGLSAEARSAKAEARSAKVGEPEPRVLSELGLRVGGPYDRQEIERRADVYEETLRARGHYEAAVTHTAQIAPGGATAQVTVDVQPGPLVRVVFSGDPLPGDRRNALVRIRDERSVDEDLLEDAARNITLYLRERGYRDASVTYTRADEGAELTITFNVTNGVLHRVSAVDVEGAASLDRSLIAPLLQLKEGEPFVDLRVGAVASAITELYHVRGFPSATVKPEVAVLPTTTADGAPLRPVSVRFQVTEGAALTVASVTVTGASAIPEAEIRTALALTEGKPFYRPQLDADRDAIERVYRNQGFQAATVQAGTEVSPDGRDVQVVWSIVEGSQTLVDHVLVTGNARIGLDVITRELQLQPGKPLGEAALVESQRRLSALGMFRRVRITELPRGAAAERDVLVEVQEAPSTTVSYGGGLEVANRLRPAVGTGDATEQLEVAPRGFFQVSRSNLWGKNRTATLFTRVSLRSRDPAVDSTDPTDTGGYGLNEYRFVGTFREPRAFNTGGDAQITAFLEQAIRSSFNFNRRGVRTEYARRAGPHITVSGRHTFDRTRLFDEQIRPEDQLLIDRLFPQVRLSTFTGSVLRDSRDDVLDPTRGTMVSAEGSVSGRAVGSEVGFAKSFFQGFVYRKVSSSPSAVTVVAGARVGLAMGFARDVPKVDEAGDPVLGDDGQQIIEVVKNLPASERFFAGGDTTVRGFALDRLGTDNTLNARGFPSGGNGLMVINVELRTAYWKGLGLVGFVDAGNVFENASDVALGDLRSAAGFGLRYRSPLGPLRVDLGFKLDRRVLNSGSRERLAILHISLGQAF